MTQRWATDDIDSNGSRTDQSQLAVQMRLITYDPSLVD